MDRVSNKNFRFCLTEQLTERWLSFDRLWPFSESDTSKPSNIIVSKMFRKCFHEYIGPIFHNFLSDNPFYPNCFVKISQALL